MKKVKILKCVIAYSMIACSLFLTACGHENEEEPIIMIDASEDDVVYNMEEVTVGDVVLTKNVGCKYVQTNDQQIVFPSGGKTVDKVYVKVGQHVEEGDLLMTLDSGNMADEIASLEYQIARNELQLGYLDKAEEFDRQSAYYNFAYTNSEKDEEELKEYYKSIDGIEESYTYQREDYNDGLEFDRRKLEKLKSDYNQNHVYAQMSGKILFIKTNLEGSVIKKDEVVMTVINNDNGLFELDYPEDASLFTEGEVVNMSIVYGDAKGDYELIPYDMNNWSNRQLFEVTVGPETATIEVGVTGTIVATIDKKENVTRIPIRALYEADGKYYTYVLNEDNMREPQFMEVGLIGDDYAEIISGIDVGMKVVRR